jgi:DNA polymerase elongation subunit (family B)
MTDLFVYSWYYTGFTVYGHCFDDAGEYRLIRVTDFMPSCFVEGETVPESTVVPAKAEYKRMLSSRDISCRRPFYRLYFHNGRDMESFARERSGRCYMADIPQVTAFLSESGADHVGWIRVIQNAISTSNHKPLVERFMDVGMRVKRSEISPVPDRIPMSSPRVMAFDIEVRSSDSGMPQPYRIADTVEMISVVVFGDVHKTYIMHTLKEPLGIDGATDLMYDNEVGLVTGFFDLVGREDPTVLTGFNVYGFDLHYLVSRLRLRLIEMPDVSRGVPGSIDLIRVDWTSGAYGNNSYDRLVIGGRVILDMYLYFRRMKLDRYSLDFVSYKFLGEGKNDMPYARMAAAFESGDVAVLKEVAEYCIQDSVLVMRLFDKVQMWIDACEIAKITRCGMEEIYTRGEQMKMVSQCVAECAKRDIVLQPQIPSEWKQYEGAYVLDPVKGVYDGCSILDFQSLYPSIIIAYNICPSTYVKPGRTLSADDAHCVDSHRFRKEPVGLLPGMIQRILDERKAVKDLMKTMSDRGSVEYIVLDRRQNALKICANSVYGMMGFKNSRYFGHLGCAESVTTVGRLLLVDIVDRIQNSYPVKVVYGDSVTGYTPTIIRVDKQYVVVETIGNMATRWGGGLWARCVDSDKEACELHGVEVWTDDGWTACRRVIRHTLAPHKKIVRVLTHTGVVDVTDEHSLLDSYGDPTDAGCVEVGERLMHHPHPPMPETEYGISPDEARIMGMFCGDGSCGTYYCSSGKKTSWSINNADPFLLLKYKLLCEKVYVDYTWTIMDTLVSSGVYKLSPHPINRLDVGGTTAMSVRYRSMVYKKKEKVVPEEILNSSEEVRKAFWEGLYDADGDREYNRIDPSLVALGLTALQKHQVSIASFALLASSLGYSISLNSRSDNPNVFRLTATGKKQKRNPYAVKKVFEIDYTGYVYDLTTDNHHFQAGPGMMIVHNTDSCMLWHDSPDKDENIKLARSICDDVTASIPSPMALKFETFCEKVILLTKKRYVLVGKDGEGSPVVSYKGVMNARRDYCKYAKDTYAEAVRMVALGTDRSEIERYIDGRIFTLVSGRADVRDLVVTKSLAKKLSAYKVNQPHVVLARRLVQKTGNDISEGTRLEYVHAVDTDTRVKCLVTPEEFAEGGWTADGRFYVDKQIATQLDDVLSAVGFGDYITDTWK